MKKLITICAVAAMVLAVSGVAQADTATAYVGTANANNAFTVLDGGNQLYFEPQPDTTNNWYYSDGSLVTYNGAARDGMKPYATTSVAYGSRLDSLSLSLDFKFLGEVDPNGANLIYQGYPNMNVAITDGLGTYAIWSPTSGGTPFTAPTLGVDGWSSLSMDLTTLADDSVYGKINETTNASVLVNGTLNTTAVLWSDIQDWTIAGFYNEQFNPTGGFGAWNETLWSTLSIADDLSTSETNEYTNTNEFGVVLFWGDTVGSMYGDGNGEIGLAAERPYGKGGKLIDNFVVDVFDPIAETTTSYDMTFTPEPATMSLLALGGLAMLKRRRRKNA